MLTKGRLIRSHHKDQKGFQANQTKTTVILYGV
jgi:hypothetical protein